MEETPIYIVFSPTSDIEGTITFEVLSDGTYTIGELQNFPDDIALGFGADSKRRITLPPTSNANYDKLAKESLASLNKELVELSLVGDLEYSLQSPSSLSYTFSSQVVDEVTLSFLAGVNISDNYGKKTKTDTEGKFTIKGEYISEDPLVLNLKLKDYSQLDKDIKTLDNKIITISNAIKLKPIKLSIEEDKQEALGATPEQKKLINQNIDKDFITTISKKILDTIKITLIPAILTLIADFGVSKLSELKNKNKFEDLNATCPIDIEGLNELIKRKNQLTKQLNNIYKSVESISKALKLPKIVIDTSEITTTATEVTFNIISNIPSTAVTPIPVGPTLILFKLLAFLKRLIKVSGGKLGAGTLQLNFILEELKKILGLLNMLDILIQGCAKEIGDDALTQIDVSNELITSTQNQSNQLSPVVTNVNGFDMGVETEITGDPLKRRRAIAKNTQGVVVLTGEYSYSSNDQILIDELVFYIQQNDLKAE
jgi:hypothetical protein